VNNAGYGQYGAVEDVPVDQVHRQFDVNVYGPHRLVRAVLPQMRRQRDGTIVNVSSVAGRIAVPGSGVYAGSKHALEAMTDSLRNEVSEYDIDAVLVEPGPLSTGFQERRAEEMTDDDEAEDLPGIERSGAYESVYALIEDATALGGVGGVTPERVAADIVNAASATRPRARYQPGPVARAGTLARHLPAAWFDAAYRLAAKLV
jgi:short-subunit dehydrogenase